MILQKKTKLITDNVYRSKTGTPQFKVNYPHGRFTVDKNILAPWIDHKEKHYSSTYLQVLVVRGKEGREKLWSFKVRNDSGCIFMAQTDQSI